MDQHQQGFKYHAFTVLGMLISLSTLHAHAATTGTIGVVSDYYARGLDQTGGVSVQGSIDYHHHSGWYLGSFASNVKWYDKTGDGTLDSDVEWDFYTGYAHKLTDSLGIDVGVYYLNYPNQTKFNTVEGYAGFNFQPSPSSPVSLSGKLHYTPDRNAYLPDPEHQDESAWYVTTQADIRLKPDLILTPQVGYAFGDTFDQARLGGLKEFVNYSLTLSKAFEQGFTVKFSYVGLNLENHDNKVILGLQKTFPF
jgi:uncharacterized protein (TIGR02001 family)